MEYVKTIIAGAFLIAGIINLSGPAMVRAEFAKFGYPDWLRMTVAATEVLGSILLLMKGTQWLGASILLAVTLGVLLSLLRSREWMRMQYPFVLLFLLVVLLGQSSLTGLSLPI